MGWNVLCAVALALGVGSGHANTITSDACAPGVRDFTVSANTVVDCLAVGAGTITGINDAFQQARPGWVFVDASNNVAGAHDGWLSGSSNLTSGLSGSFSINAAAYGAYDRIAVGLRSGAGQLDPDWAVFELADNTLTATWSISRQQQLTHAVLYGFGVAPTSAVPEPGMLALVGLGLASLTALRRRRPR